MAEGADIALPALPEVPRVPSARFHRCFGLLVISVIFGGIALWSIFAPIKGAVIAQGRIVVESNRKIVQHLEGGIVAAIHVREGDRVSAGDTLIELDATVASANLALLDGQLAELYARRARLEAERDAMEALPEGGGVSAVLASEGYKTKRLGQKQLFEARRQSLNTQVSLLEERIVQQTERIAGLKAQIASLKAQSRLIADELKGVKDLHAQGYAPATLVRQLEREEKRLDGESGALHAALAESESLIAEARLEIERLFAARREEAIKELRDVEASVAEAEDKRIAIAKTRERTHITSPQSGRVFNLAAHTIGGVVAPGQAIMEIVPEGDRLLVAASIAPQDVDRVEAGQETLVRFSGFGGRRTPETLGAVSTVSADSLVDEKTGVAYYLAYVEFQMGEELRESLNGRELAPGMPAEVFIRTGARPAISYFLKPLQDAASRALRED